MKNTEERLRKVLIEFGIDQESVSKDSDYYFDLNLDMLDLLRVASKIRKEFRVSIPDNEIFRMERISDTIYFIEQKPEFVSSCC
ncbi:MAG: acyl carrier protein [Bacteroidales bacterium]|nr:acyl carrier protein [Bacteroidales bacterium]